MIYKTLIVMLVIGFMSAPVFSHDIISKAKVIATDRTPTPGLGFVISDRANVPPCPSSGPVIVQSCPSGQNIVLFDSPDYDESGLFLVCTKVVPYCIPVGAKPEG